MFDRREFLKLAVIAGVGASVPAVGQPKSNLKDLGAASGVEIGTALNLRYLSDTQFAAFVLDNFSLITPGVELKWAALRPSPDTFNFYNADKLIAWARAHSLEIHGHNLCWQVFNPDWFGRTLTRANAQQYLTTHITTVMRHYKCQIPTWDVVNEPIGIWENRPDGLRLGPWLDLIGPDYIDIAFHAAKDADPSPLRILNLNGAERQDYFGDRTRAATLTLIQQLLKRGVPLQAIGLQGHLRAPYTADHAPFIRFVSQLRELGLQVLVTELDINDIDVKGDAAQVRSVVASSYATFLSTLIPAAQPKRIIFGTPTDRYSWYDQSAKTNPGYRRSDGAPHYAGLLDGSLNASPALSSVRAAVAQFRRTGA
jgi:endo-1,4-beta-xylanase